MREILFRGYSTALRKWLEGDLIHSPDINHPVICNNESFVNVSKKTIGQYTGLTDKNGKKIFEGDIVRAQDDIIFSPFCDGITGKIVYDECAFFIEPTNPMDSHWLYNECAEYEVIGNIHDNPELFKKGR